MNIFKKALIVILVASAMYLAFFVVSYLKSKINVHRNMGTFLFLLLLSFSAVFMIILILGFIFTQFRNFFFAP